MEKEEFYKSFIELQKHTGQGTSGIVKLGSEPRIGDYLDEFIEEGLCKACSSGGSIGHPESNIFYMPTKGYNMWDDSDRHYMVNLMYVRCFIATETGSEFVDPDDGKIKSDPEYKKDYEEWLNKNRKSLEEMLNLEEDYNKAKKQLKTKHKQQ